MITDQDKIRAVLRYLPDIQNDPNRFAEGMTLCSLVNDQRHRCAPWWEPSRSTIVS